MSRVLYVRLDPAAHAGIVDAAHAARTSLQDFCLQAILEAAERWQPLTPPAAHAACDESISEAAEL